MRRKVSWLFFWFTMVFWLGSAGGCATSGQDQNYKILEDQGGIHRSVPVEPGNEHLQSQRNSLVAARIISAQLNVTFTSDFGPVEMAAAKPVSKPIDNTEASQPTQAKATKQAPKKTDTPALKKAASNDTEPSLKGLDRSHWKPITVNADTSSTSHGPTYFGAMSKDEASIQADKPSAALNGAEPAGWDGDNAKAVWQQPALFLWDVVCLPYRLYTTPPCSKACSKS